MVKKIWLLSVTLLLIILCGCTKSKVEQSSLITVLDQLSNKQIIAKSQVKDNIILFMGNGNSLDSGLLFGPGYSNFCGGGSISLENMPEVAAKSTECNYNSAKKTRYISFYTGLITNNNIERLEVQYSAGNHEYKGAAEILETKMGYKVWHLFPETSGEYHLTLLSLTGYSGDGKVVYNSTFAERK